MSVDDDSDECMHGLGMRSACTICNGRDRRERAEDASITHTFVARYSGTICAQCGVHAEAGDTLAARADGLYVCSICAEFAQVSRRL